MNAIIFLVLRIIRMKRPQLGNDGKCSPKFCHFLSVCIDKSDWQQHGKE